MDSKQNPVEDVLVSLRIENGAYLNTNSNKKGEFQFSVPTEVYSFKENIFIEFHKFRYKDTYLKLGNKSNFTAKLKSNYFYFPFIQSRIWEDITLVTGGISYGGVVRNELQIMDNQDIWLIGSEKKYLGYRMGIVIQILKYVNNGEILFSYDPEFIFRLSSFNHSARKIIEPPEPAVFLKDDVANFELINTFKIWINRNLYFKVSPTIVLI